MWSSPERTNGIIRHYQVELGIRNYFINMNLDIIWSEIVVDPFPLYYTFTGLLPTHTYFVRVAAITVVRGNYSSIEIVRLNEGGKYM